MDEKMKEKLKGIYENLSDEHGARRTGGYRVTR